MNTHIHKALTRKDASTGFVPRRDRTDELVGLTMQGREGRDKPRA
jgi:hypothetical protein